MKTMYSLSALLIALFLITGYTSKQEESLTQQHKDQIKKEIAVIGDSILVRTERLSMDCMEYYVDSPDWGMVSSDGRRWDYQYTIKSVPDFFKTTVSWKWTTIHQDFKFLTKDIVICAWDGKDETIMKSGDKVI